VTGNRVWPHRDPGSHASAPGALQPAPPDRTVHPQPEAQALHAQLQAYQEARSRDRDRLRAWRRAVRQLVELIDPLALHDRLRIQPDFAETATPDAWLELAAPAIAALHDRARPAAPEPPPGRTSATRCWMSRASGWCGATWKSTCASATGTPTATAMTPTTTAWPFTPRWK